MPAANISKADIQAGQSILHLIDSILIPPPFVPLFKLISSNPTIYPVTYTASLGSANLIPKPSKASAAKGTVSIQVINSTFARGALTLNGITNAISAKVCFSSSTLQLL
jgi:hypothetical protein